MVLCDSCRNQLPDMKCNYCNELKPVCNFKPNSKICNDCHKLRYEVWKEINRDKWCVGGKYYKYVKKNKHKGEGEPPHSPSKSSQ